MSTSEPDLEPEALPPAPRLRSSELPALEDDEQVVANIPVETEDTALAELSPEDLYNLNQEAFTDTISTRPLIDGITPMETIREEYENGSPNFLAQIDSLRKMGYKSIRRAKGDGDCFYRALTFAYLEKIIQAPDKALAVQLSLSVLETTLPMLQEVGFEPLVYEDFFADFKDLIMSVTPSDGQEPLNEAKLLEKLQRPEVSNAIVVYLRLVTSAHMRKHEEDFLPFLIHPEFQELVPVGNFCEAFVEATGKEADHVQITALSQALQLNLRIAYLDGRSTEVNFVDFNHARDAGVVPIVLLYRPGHYDILVTDM